MKTLLSLFTRQPAIEVAIEADLLAALIRQGHLHAADFRCLNLNSKQRVWRILLDLAKTV